MADQQDYGGAKVNVCERCRLEPAVSCEDTAGGYMDVCSNCAHTVAALLDVCMIVRTWRGRMEARLDGVGTWTRYRGLWAVRLERPLRSDVVPVRKRSGRVTHVQVSPAPLMRSGSVSIYAPVRASRW